MNGDRTRHGCLSPRAPTALTLERNAPPMEKNGFTIVDVTPEKMVCHLFAWREPDPLAAIASLEPYDVLEIARG